MDSQDIKTIYMMGIGGIAMGTLATMLKEGGFHVIGSDQHLYPPMSTHLEALHIPVCQGYKAENLQHISPDLIIIGNVIRRDNPEAQFVLQNGLPYLSMPQAISRIFLAEHHSIVVAGTHGKSTTSALASWMLAHAGKDPGALIGGFLKNWQRSYRLGKGRYMVIEGDEYDTAFFDKGPKFLHYRPHIGVITSVEYDHADIFPDFDSVFEAFRRFVHLITPDGHLVVNADDPHCLELARECRGNVLTYGWSEKADWRLLEASYGPGEVRFRYRNTDFHEHTMKSPLPGRHNLSNTLAVLAVASLAGLSTQEAQEALLSFQGVRRRQDIVGEHNGVLIIDDFAHHPTAVRETIQALRLYYPDRRLIAVFEPRTNSSRRRIFQEQYETAFAGASRVCIKEPPDMEKIPKEERLNTERLVRNIQKQHQEASYFQSTDDLLSFLVKQSSSGDLILCMSNGSFDNLPKRLSDALIEKGSE